jgi:hypothetical protein
MLPIRRHMRNRIMPHYVASTQVGNDPGRPSGISNDGRAVPEEITEVLSH